MGFEQENSQSRWVKAVAAQGTLRAVALQCVDLVRHACAQHKLQDPDQQKALGESLVSGLLLASYLKMGERTQLKLSGSGKYRGAVVDSTPDGKVRGYLLPEKEPRAGTQDGDSTAPLGPWGQGTLSVLRTREMERQLPYLGAVPLVTGHLAKDLSFYWLQSEQVPTAVGIYVETLTSGGISKAGGFLLQVLPGASEAQVKSVEEGLQHQDPATEKAVDQAFVMNDSPDQSLTLLLHQLLGEQGFMRLEERELNFACGCNQTRVSEALALLEPEELKEMIAKREVPEVSCDFCGTTYTFREKDLEYCLNRAMQIRK